MTCKIMPLYQGVIIKMIEEKEETLEGGIILPSSVEEEKGPARAEVMAVGSGEYQNGIRVPCSVKPGDIVVFDEQYARELSDGLHIIYEHRLFGVEVSTGE